MSEAQQKPTTKQLEILRLFYRFRFLTSNHLSIMLDLNRTNPNQIHQRLQILIKNKYIDRHYDDEPKIYTSNLDRLKTIQPGYDRVWRDVEEPKEVVGLHQI
jgi:SOS-response transcriptional repressor LexA